MLNERKLSKDGQDKLKQVVDTIAGDTKRRRKLVKKHGPRAAQVVQGIAVKAAQKYEEKQAETMDQDKIKEAVKSALKNPKKADLNKDGKLSPYEEKRGAAIEKSMNKESIDEMDRNDPKDYRVGYEDEDDSLHYFVTKVKSEDEAEIEATKKPGFKRMKSIEKLDEMDDRMEDYNNPSNLKFRQAQMKREKEAAKPKRRPLYGKQRGKVEDVILDIDQELKGLYSDRKYTLIDMEQEAEPEGGPIADRYGNELNKIENQIQSLIAKKDKLEARLDEDTLQEGFYGSSYFENVVNALGYDGIDHFFEDNPGAVSAIMNWVESIPEFEEVLKDANLMETDSLNEERPMGTGTTLDGGFGFASDESYELLKKIAKEKGAELTGMGENQRFISFSLATTEDDIYTERDYFYDKVTNKIIEKGISKQLPENINEDDLGERGYIAGKKAAYTYGTLVTKLQNRPDKLAFKKGFVQGVIDELGSDINENINEDDLGERGYIAGKKAAYTYGTLVTKLQNRPDKLAFKKGFVQGVIDELGSDINENINEDLDLGHQDNEPHMLKADLYRIGKYAMELYQMVDGFEGQGEVDFPHWWQSKVIKSKDALVSAKHYLDFELKEPQIDAMVDVATEEDVIDENIKSKINSLFKAAQKKLGVKNVVRPTDADFDAAHKHIEDNYPEGYTLMSIGVDAIQDKINIEVGDFYGESEDIVIDRPSVMVDVAQDVEAINEFDDESMTAYQKAVKKVYRPKYDGSVQMPSQEEVDAFFKSTGNELHYLANKPVFGDLEPWDEYDYSNWKELTRNRQPTFEGIAEKLAKQLKSK
jgi:hypothetical protein